MMKVVIEDHGMLQRLEFISFLADGIPVNVMQNIGAILVQDLKDGIIEGGKPNKFTPTKLGNKPLIGSGALSNSGMINSVSKNHVTVSMGSGLKYAPIHQFSGTIVATKAPYLKFKMGDNWVQKKSVTIPPRRYVRFYDQTVEKIKQLLSDYILYSPPTQTESLYFIKDLTLGIGEINITEG